MKSGSKAIALCALLAIVMGGVMGCTTIRARNGGEVNTVKASKDIYNVTRAATTLAIVKVKEDDVDEQIKVAAILVARLDTFVLPLLTNPEAEVTQALAERLLEEVPEEYQGLMIAAYETFNTHYEFPATSEILPEPYLTYLRSFLKGVRDGAEDVLKKNGAHLDVGFELHKEETANGG